MEIGCFQQFWSNVKIYQKGLVLNQLEGPQSSHSQNPEKKSENPDRYAGKRKDLKVEDGITDQSETERDAQDGALLDSVVFNWCCLLTR